VATPLALVDCNNFYASCERLFQPALRGKPVVVLSNNDGCVIARSNEAKALGIEMGAPWHLHKERFSREGVIVRSSNYTLYGDISARVMRTLADFTPDLEIYSIDEAFLGLGGFEDRLEAHARALRATVLQWTGIPVSVGIAPTKTLAKAANRMAKKDTASGGVAILLTPEAQEAALARMELTDLWGIARRMAERLTAIGITTPLALRDADPRFIRERFSVVTERQVYELRGIPCIAFEEATPDRKSIMASRSFGRPVTTREEMEEAVATYAARAAEKMRRQGLATCSMVIFVETNRFRPGDPQHYANQPVQLAVATADTGKLAAAARRGLAAIWRPGFRYKKAGVIFLNLCRAADVQGGLFDAPDTPARQCLLRVVDGLNARYGRDTITYAASGRKRAWKLRNEQLSQRYTTSWEELLTV
jgi:DNA polymerase V